MNFLYIIILFTSFSGFLISFYIKHKKGAHENLVCPLNFSCDTVIYSQYSKFFGIPLENIGMAYYGVVAVYYTVLLAYPALGAHALIFGILTASTGAFLFSIYLTFIQAFNLKQWCSWCLISAGLCTIIFFSAIFGSEVGFVELMKQYKGVLGIAHALGIALGLGGATIADIFFFRFLRDFKISEWETGVMNVLSQIIWFALALLVFSGITLYAPASATLNIDPRFQVKVLGVLIIIINGAFLNLLIAPQLVNISFHEKIKHPAGHMDKTRRLAFALGAVSLTSWYTVFLLGSLHGLEWSFSLIVGTYISALIIGVVGSQIAERIIVRRAGKTL